MGISVLDYKVHFNAKMFVSSRPVKKTMLGNQLQWSSNIASLFVF